MTLLDVAAPTFVRRELTDTSSPIKKNGELRLAEILTSRGIDHVYERFLYPLTFNSQGEPSSAFAPDFWIPKSEIWPEFNIELTWADRMFRNPNLLEQHYAHTCLRRKQEKVKQLRQLYGLETLLLTFRDWRLIDRHPSYLEGMINDLFSSHSQPSRLTA